MRIRVDYNEQESDFDQLKIDSAKYLSDYAIRIRFSSYYDLIFPIWDLYNGKIES